MQSGDEELTTLLSMGGVEYALKKLRRWRGEGPTERNRKMSRFLIKHGSFGSDRSHALMEHPTLLINLALEWGDFAMWEEVLNKSTGKGDTPKLSLNELIQAWDVFTFDRTKNMLVHSIPVPMPLFSCLRFPEEWRRLSAINRAQGSRSSG